MPNGRIMQTDRNQRGLRDAVQSSDTATEFQEGSIPHKIMRRYFSNDRGILDGEVNYFPVTGSQEYMMHQMTPRNPRSRAGRYGIPTIDETLATPSVGVGDAV